MRFKLRNIPIGLMVYGYAVAFSIGAAGAFATLALAVYVGACMLICKAMIAKAESRKNSNTLEFSRDGAANAIGTQYGSFFHVFQSPEPVIETVKVAIGNALKGKLGCSDLKFIAFKDIDRDLEKPETRTFLLISAPETGRKSNFHFLATFGRERAIQTVRWWILVGGEKDPNKVFWRFLLSPITIPFMLLPYLRREHDPLSGLMTVFPGFFNGIDVLSRTKEISFIAFETLVEILDQNGIDTTDLKQQRASIMNVNVSGGQATIGSMVQGAMNKVGGSVGASKS